MWIESEWPVNQAGFLVEYDPQGRESTFVLRDHPARTNRSHEPRLTGWCGETNNVNIHAHGVWRVVAIAANSRRRLVEVRGADLIRFLAEAGYSELAEHSRV